MSKFEVTRRRMLRGAAVGGLASIAASRLGAARGQSARKTFVFTARFAAVGPGAE